MDSGKLSCELAGLCSGCSWWEHTHGEQLSKKQALMGRTLKQLPASPSKFELDSTGFERVRSRLDLTLQKQESSQVMGLYSLDRLKIVDMKRCPMALASLDQLLQYLREVPLPSVNKGSLRLRVSPQGEWGVWIDFSNLDIKALLEEGSWLEHLQKKCRVEIGQKSKVLGLKPDGRWGLFDPEIRPWFETYVGFDLQPHPLFLRLSGFTQTGFSSNRRLIEICMEEVRKAEVTEVFEFFCGSGNFTLPLLSQGLRVTALEVDGLALQGLERSFNLAQTQEKAATWGQLRTLQQDLYRLKEVELEAPAWIVDPPRSGLKGLLDILASLGSKRPRSLIYISCYLESWQQDAERLLAMGYKLESVRGVDQFPQTPHCEWVTRFSL